MGEAGIGAYKHYLILEQLIQVEDGCLAFGRDL